MTRPCGCGGSAALTCNCVLVPGPRGVVTGTGVPEDPYVVGAEPISCTEVQDCVAETIGEGLAWDAGAREISVQPSADPGNVLLFGSDGGLYVSEDGTVTPAQPRARIGRTGGTPQSPGSGVLTVVTFDAAASNVGGVWDAGMPNRLTAPREGGYTLGATVMFGDATGTDVGTRAVLLRLNGTDLIAEDRRGAVNGSAVTVNVSTSRDLVAGDYLEVLVHHTQGAAVSLPIIVGMTPTAWMYYTTEGV